jgi:SNARE protein
MESSTLAMLKDHKKKGEDIIQKIKDNFIRMKSIEKSEQSTYVSKIGIDLRILKNTVDAMNIDIKELKNDQDEKTFKNYIDTFKQEYKKLSEELEQKKREKTGLDALILDDIQLGNKGAHEMNQQEMMEHGTHVLKDDRKAIDNMKREVKTQLDYVAEIKKDLNRQNEQLDQIEGDIKEMDYSLKRAGKQLATMFKMYATDKLILILIVLIVLVIIGIIVASAVGGDPKGNFNVPHDIFGAKNNTATTTTTTST